MDKIAELKARLAVAVRDCEEFLRAHENNGALNEEDKKVYDSLLAKAMDLKTAINRAEELRNLNAELDAPTSAPIVEQPGNSAAPKVDRMKAFMDYVRGNLTRSQVLNALEEGVDSEGGYLVPDEFERRLMERLGEENAIRRLATVIRTSYGERKIPVVASEGTAAWIDEEGSYTESDDAFGQVVLSAFKAGTLVKVSDELLQDSAFDLESYIINAFAKRIGALEEAAFCTGNGTGKPTGIFTANGGSVGVTTAEAGKITADEIIDLVYSLKAPYRRNARFVMNDSVVKYVRKLKDGQGQFLWQPSLQEGQPDRLYNYEVVTTPSAPEISSGALVIAFGDFSYYWIADREGMSIKRLEELYAATGQVGFRGSRRVDGKIIFSEAIKLLQMHA